MNHTWPCNVRELENVIERLYVFCDGEVTENDLPGSVREPESRHSLLMEDVEKQHIARVLYIKDGNLNRTALALGIALNTLKSKIR